MFTFSWVRVRILRFRLRSLLIVVTILSVGLAFVAQQRRRSARDSETARALAKLGFREIHLGGPYDSIERHWEGVDQGWWRDMSRQILGERIIVVAQGRSGITDLAPLGDLADLYDLDVSGTSVVDLSPLTGLSTLRSLDLCDTDVSDITPLTSLQHLEELNLTGSDVIDLSPLRHSHRLRVLYLTDTRVTDLSPLHSLDSLEVLYLNSIYVEFSDEQIDALQEALPKCDIDY